MKSMAAAANGAPTPNPALASKFDGFDIIDVTYKHVNGTAIPASILIPRNIKEGKHPLTIRWHGGFLVTGHKLYADWYAQWLLDLYARHDAIAITVDYRLMPESNGLEILEDVKDFYSWLFASNDLVAHLPEGVSVDLNHLLVTGESAGGWLALQSAFMIPERISAVVMQYPMIDLRDKHYTQKYQKNLFNSQAPQIPESVLNDFLANMEAGKVVTGATPPERLPLVLSIVQQGRMEVFGDHSSLYPLEVLDGGNVKQLPPMWLLHGIQDSAVPVDGSYNFVEKLKQKDLYDESKLHLTYEDGEHGLDNHMEGTGEPASLTETSWIKDGVAFVDKFWPAKA